MVNRSYHLYFLVRKLANYQTDKFILMKLIKVYVLHIPEQICLEIPLLQAITSH